MRKLHVALALALIPLVNYPSASAENKIPSNTIRPRMDGAYHAFRALQPYLFNRNAFVDPANAKVIRTLLLTMESNFHRIEKIPAKHAKEPGFAATLKVINTMLYDAKNRFEEGKKDYALWRLRDAGMYCVSCHARYNDGKKFYDNQVVSGLNPFQEGEFYLASRQFDKAKERYLAAAKDPALVANKLAAVRGYLIVVTRAAPDPIAALETLNQLTTEAAFLPYELDEINDWKEALTRWKEEPPSELTPLQRAESLIKKSLAPDDIVSQPGSAIELLRATAIIHELLATREKISSTESSRALYLLGLSYYQLPLFFVSELPVAFLEQCIREFPGTTDAKSAFKLYREIVILDYTGSAGTDLPSDVALKIGELHDIAYGIPHMPEQVKKGETAAKG